MSVRKRKWTTRSGEAKEAWIVDYTDGAGVRRARFFQRKKDADAYHAEVKTEVAAGVHTPPRQSITIRQA